MQVPPVHNAALRLSVIIPIRNRREHLISCLAAIAASSRKADEIVVVDDSSGDDSADVARGHGCRVVSLTGGAHGPARARNRGVAASSGNIIVFVDSDVLVHQETLLRIEQQFLADAGLCGLFGSYDDNPTAPGIVSGYRNLLHHHVHTHNRRNASTFWAGCGAIRRDAFLAADGFDETYPWLEDVELGLRLHAGAHRLLLCPEIQATHRKHWSFWGMIKTDIMCRAVPWTKLILQRRSLPNDLNLRHKHRLSAVAAWLIVCLLALGTMHPTAYLATIIPIAILFGFNWGLYR